MTTVSAQDLEIQKLSEKLTEQAEILTVLDSGTKRQFHRHTLADSLKLEADQMKSDNPSASHRTAHVSLMVLTVLLTTWGAALATLWAGSNKWTSIGPFGGSIQAVAIDPQNPSTLYAGTSSGIFKSTDGGASWNALNNAIAWNLAIDPRTPSTLYAGGFGVFKSKRLEFRWEALNALNHPQFTQFPERDVTSPGPVPGSPSRFLNRDFTDSGIRSMWVQLKVLF